MTYMARSYHSGSHSRYDLKVHLIWIPKYRKRVLIGEFGEAVRDLIRRLCSEMSVTILTGKVASDHIHLFVSYPPELSISDMMQHIKGKSAHTLLNDYPRIAKIFWGRHLWARGYCAVSSGSITDELIQKYIEDQEGEDLHGPIEMST